MDDHFLTGPSPSAARRTVGRRPVVLAGLFGVAALAGCDAKSPASDSQPTDDPATTSPAAAPVESSPAPDPGATASSSPGPLEGWTMEQKVGQLLMVGAETSGAQKAALDAVSAHHIGNVFIAKPTRSGADAVRDVVASLTGLVGPETTHSTPMLVATDQEGGQVQVLGGAGFSDIPSASEQAATSRDDLAAEAQTWGKELADVGITMNLAPVADLVDISDPSSNLSLIHI